MKYIALIKPTGEITAEPVSKSNLLADSFAAVITDIMKALT